MAARPLPTLSAPAGPVRHRPDLPVHHSPPHPDRQPASAATKLGQHPGHERRYRRGLGPAGSDGRAAIPAARLRADDAARVLDRGVAVLYPASIRGYLLGGGSGVGPRHRRAAGQLLLRPAAASALADRLHRFPPYPSPKQQGAELSFARLLRAELGALASQTPHAARQLAMPAARLMA